MGILGGSTDWCRGSEQSPPDDILERGRSVYLGIGIGPDISPLANLSWMPRDRDGGEGSSETPQSQGGRERVLLDITIW